MSLNKLVIDRHLSWSKKILKRWYTFEKTRFVIIIDIMEWKKHLNKSFFALFAKILYL